MKNKTQELTLIGISTAVLILMAQLAIPMPSGVPVTLQTFGISLIAFILGAKRAGIATVIYIVLGAIGLPVFSAFSGGMGSLFGLTGGFILGFLPMSIITGLGNNLGNKVGNKIISLVFGLLGLFVCHLFGASQYAILSGIDIFASLMAVSIPYLVKDIIVLVMAKVIAETVVFALKKAKINL